MLKRLRLCSMLLGGIFCLGAFAACDKDKYKCTHEYQYYTVQEATCTEKGTLEVRCSLCGELHYEDIQPAGHTMPGGICSVCGYDGSVEGGDPSLAAFYSLDDIYAEIKKAQPRLTQEEFILNARNARIEKIYVNGLGNVKACVNGVYVNLGKIRTAYKNPNPPTSVIRQVVLSSGALSVLCEDNIYQGGLGNVKGLAESQNPIVGFAINMQNELLLLYENNAVRVVGLLSKDLSETDNETLTYIQAYGGFGVYGPLNQTIEQAEIPYSYHGRQVEGVLQKAFYGCERLERVSIAEGVRIIQDKAFSKCTALTEIRIPASMKTIERSAFKDCAALQKVYYEGTQEEWSNIQVSSLGNECLTSAQIIYNA